MGGTNLAGGGQTGSFGTDGGPSGEIYGGLEVAYRWFNERLFEGKLPGVVFTLHRGSAMNSSIGYYHAERFGRRKHTEGAPVDEIAMNLTYFGHQTVQEVMSTLCHEMAHAYQTHFLKRPRSGYHCRVFADLMLKIGLPTSDTGLPGGNSTGQRMDHMIEKGGAFQRAFDELADAEFLIGWYERFPRNALQSLPAVVVEKNEEGEWVVTEESLQLTTRVMARNREIADRFATQGGGAGLLRTVVDEIVNNVPLR